MSENHNCTHLINAAAVRRAFLDRIQVVRAGTTWAPTRVSQEALDAVERAALRAIDRIIESHPTVGKTVNP